MSETSNFTRENVTRVIEEIVAERPDYVYEAPYDGSNCVYGDNGAPSCLVGHVIHRIDPEFFIQVTDNHEFKAANELPWPAGTADEVPDALTCAQGAQDAGERWDLALDYYRDSLRDYDE